MGPGGRRRRSCPSGLSPDGTCISLDNTGYQRRIRDRIDGLRRLMKHSHWNPHVPMMAGWLLFGSAVALAAAADTVLTWPAAVREAIASNGELRAAQDGFEAAQSRRRAAASGYYPQ